MLGRGKTKCINKVAFEDGAANYVAPSSGSQDDVSYAHTSWHQQCWYYAQRSADRACSEHPLSCNMIKLSGACTLPSQGVATSDC